MKRLTAQTNRKIKELIQEVDPELARRLSLEAAYGLANERLLDAFWAYSQYDTFKGVTELRIIWGEKLLNSINHYLKEVRRVRAMKQGKQDITPEMIENAKSYPFEELIELKRGYACCPFHEEKRPSFRVKDNKAWCYSCNRGWDTIDFVMEKEGVSFPEAVRRLQ